MTDLSLSRRAMAAGYQSGVGLDDGALLWIRVCDGSIVRIRRAPGEMTSGPEIIGPDLDDDATLGCLEGQVRRAWQALHPGCEVYAGPCFYDGWIWQVRRHGPIGDCALGDGATLAEALVAALEAHHDCHPR